MVTNMEIALAFLWYIVLPVVLINIVLWPRGKR
jgi:hypothetical protein